MSKYNSWTVVFNEQPSESKWNLLGSNDSYHEEVINDGWTEANETWTYASADDPTFTFTISGDKTGKYTPGSRLRLKQAGAYKYFLVTAVSYSSPNTTVTIYGGTDYDLANAAITDNWLSQMKSPVAFPLDPNKWKVEATDTSQRQQATPVQNTWYNSGTITFSLPIGIWDVEYHVMTQIKEASATQSGVYQVTLSTANNSESDADMTSSEFLGGASGTLDLIAPNHKRKDIVLTTKTSYFLNQRTTTASIDEIDFRGDLAKTIVRAVSRYL